MIFHISHRCCLTLAVLALTSQLSLTAPSSAVGQTPSGLSLPPAVHVAQSNPQRGDADSPADKPDATDGSAATDADQLPPRSEEPAETNMANSLLNVSKGGVTTMVGSLAIVIGLFLMMAWFAKRNMPASQRWLSTDVVQVLGRAPLSNKQVMHLVRLGPKLLLVSVSTQGAETLAEVSDPAEVERLLARCQQTSDNSVTQSFRDVLTQFEREPVEGFLEDPAMGAR